MKFDAFIFFGWWIKFKSAFQITFISFGQKPALCHHSIPKSPHKMNEQAKSKIFSIRHKTSAAQKSESNSMFIAMAVTAQRFQIFKLGFKPVAPINFMM